VKTQPGDDRSRHVPALDGLRGVAVLLVLFFHFTMFGRLRGLAARSQGAEGLIGSRVAELAMSAWIGVDLFFVLSGYLITTILLEEKGRAGFFRRFYGRRAARILPLYYAFLAGYAAFMAILGSPAKLRTLGWPLLFGTNIALGLFGDGAIPHEIQHLWSLAIEEQFYLLFPVLVAVTSRGTLRWVCVLGVLVALAFRIVVRPDLPLTGFLTPARFDGLLCGAFVAAAIQSVRLAPTESTERLARLSLLAGFVALGAFVIWRGSLKGQDLIVDVYGRLPLNVFFATVVGSCVMTPQSILARILALAPLRFFGRYSYAMYLLHIPLLAGMFAAHVDIGRLSRASGSLLLGYVLFLGIATSVTTLAALASYYALERRFLVLRERMRTVNEAV
jgi:peptidoglycan/LPS O-acetylase OafA/YrhL